MSESQPRAGTLTFFFSDVEGSTRAATALGRGFAQALEDHRREVRAALAAEAGREVSTAGDSFFAVFPDAGRALRAAAAIQRTAARGDGLRARIGLHTGDAVVIGDDFVGLDVHRAARISDAGHGGQILISDTTREALGAEVPPSLRLVDLGRHRLKDVGPERLWEVRGDGLPTEPFPALRTLEAHPTNLPLGGPPLVDRERERQDLADHVDRASVVSITGPGGIGKSRLAIEVARLLVERFPDGVFHVDLASTPDAAAVVGAVADAVGIRGTGEAVDQAALLDRLRDRDLLVVLDTADRVTGLPELVATIASTCPRIRVLVTSRSRLRIAAEREYPVGPLATDAAVELFRRRATDARPGFTLDAAARGVVERLVARLDGIPLAIELAAARARLFSPQVLLDRLERRLPALGEAGADAPARQRTLHAAIAWSCELLSPPEQSAFAQLGVFAGSFDIAAIDTVIAVPGSDPASLLERLVDRSLAVVEDTTPSRDGVGSRPGGGTGAETVGPRFRLLGPIREFASDALRAGGSEAEVRDRHARHFLQVVREQTEPPDAELELAAVGRLRLVEPDLRDALDWCLTGTAEAARAEVGFELASRLGPYWAARGEVGEGLGWLTRALELDVEADPQMRVRALQWAGILHDDAGQPVEAAKRLEAALALRRDLGDGIQVARLLNSLGVVARSMGDLPRAKQMMLESLHQKELLGDRRGTAISFSNLGIVAADEGNHAESAELMRRALAIDQELGVAGGVALVVGAANLASALTRAGRHEEGLTELRGALPGIAELGDPELVVEALVTAAEAALVADQPDADTTAARLILAAEHLREAARVRIHAPDRARMQELQSMATAGLDRAVLDALAAEARAVDVEAGVGLAREAVERLSPRS